MIGSSGGDDQTRAAPAGDSSEDVVFSAGLGNQRGTKNLTGRSGRIRKTMVPWLSCITGTVINI